MHSSPAKGNFCDESGNAPKPAIMEDYNRHTGQVDKNDRMVNSHYQSLYIEMDGKKLFCHFLILKIPTATCSWSPVVLKFHTETSQTDTCQEYERNCWTAATPTTNCRKAISFESSCQHWPTTIETRMDCLACHACTKNRCRIQSAKSVTLGCAYHTKTQL